MTWARLDDQFYNHPKLADLGDLMLPCVGLHTLALCYCSAYLTDGRIPRGQIHRLAGDLSNLLSKGLPWELVELLVLAGIWEREDPDFDGEEDEYTGDYVVHDYLEYNPSRAHVLQLREKRALSGQRGGLAKAKQHASKAQAKTRQKSAPAPAPAPKKRPSPLSPSSSAHAAPDGFARFWAEYPRKIGQPRTLKAWRALHPNNGQLDAVLQGLTRWRAYWVRQQTPSDRIPYPATWLNDRRWEAELGEAPEDEYAKFPRN